MKTIFKPLMKISAIAITLFLASCDNDTANDILRDDDPTVTNEIIVNPTNAASGKRSIEIEAKPGATVKVKTTFTGDKNMYRLYMTKNVLGSAEGAQPFEYPDLGAKKKDGSIDLPKKDKKEFTYTFDFAAPASENEVVQYILWVTKARGDYRDVSNDNAIADDAYGVITIKGNPNASADGASFKSFSTVLLASPLSDGTSKSFISLFDGQTYAISQGEEYAALWDFGYYYGNSAKASFASAANYPSDIVDVVAIGKTEDLNNCYFKLSSKSTGDFDAVTKASDLDFISKSTNERVKGLKEGDVVEFVDAYGNKGLIKVTKIVPGFGTGKKIEFDVKVQVQQVPVKG